MSQKIKQDIKQDDILRAEIKDTYARLNFLLTQAQQMLLEAGATVKGLSKKTDQEEPSKIVRKVAYK